MLHSPETDTARNATRHDGPATFQPADYGDGEVVIKLDVDVINFVYRRAHHLLNLSLSTPTLCQHVREALSDFGIRQAVMILHGTVLKTVGDVFPKSTVWHKFSASIPAHTYAAAYRCIEHLPAYIVVTSAPPPPNDSSSSSGEVDPEINNLVMVGNDGSLRDNPDDKETPATPHKDGKKRGTDTKLSPESVNKHKQA